MAKVSIDFSSHNYTDQDLCIKANTISGDLTNNPDFPTLAQDAVLIGTTEWGLNRFSGENGRR